ncbi:MAG: hypothetical protein JNM35_16685, partial [Nitrospira sp.]|nr:hypothetical protein [Nitrospira sp.]
RRASALLPGRMEKGRKVYQLRPGAAREQGAAPGGGERKIVRDAPPWTRVVEPE